MKYGGPLRFGIALLVLLPGALLTPRPVLADFFTSEPQPRRLGPCPERRGEPGHRLHDKRREVLAAVRPVTNVTLTNMITFKEP